MKNILELLHQKEAELQELQKEVEALRLASRLLADGEPAPAPVERAIHPLRTEKVIQQPRSGKVVARPVPPVEAKPEPAPREITVGAAALRQFP
jgi:hypothetical protein